MSASATERTEGEIDLRYDRKADRRSENAPEAKSADWRLAHSAKHVLLRTAEFCQGVLRLFELIEQIELFRLTDKPGSSPIIGSKQRLITH